jgi:FSR family fosmidomycin resistance protein-like MFS transporter
MASDKRAMDVRGMALLAFGHVTDDINQSFIAAVLPFLIISLHLSYASAATLVLGQAISSSVIQPAIGLLADRRPLPWLIPVGLLLAGGGIALIGIAPSFALAFCAALVSGIGVACFHPEAARFANFLAGSRKATGMRWFAAGGNVGFAIGPLFATAAIAAWGLHGTLIAFAPVALLALLIFIDIPRLKTFLPARRKAGTHPEYGDDWPSFIRLSFFVTIRSMTYLGMVTFIPLYAIGQLHLSVVIGASLLTTFLMCGVAGTLAGGPLADRFGRRVILIASMAGACLLVAGFVAITHAGFTPVLVVFALACIMGFVLVASQTSFIVLGQEYLPNHIGVASGVTLGLGVSLGGMFTPVLGLIADHYGLSASLLTVSFLCFVALCIALTLPPKARNLPYVRPGNPNVASAS